MDGALPDDKTPFSPYPGTRYFIATDQRSRTVPSYYIVDKYHPSGKPKHEPEEIPQAAMIAYRKHVARGTVPTSGIPYTRTGIERYRHTCVMDELDTRMRFPAWVLAMGRRSTSDHRTAANFPAKYRALDAEHYIREFDRLNGLRSI